jgi:hypothetical protein
MGILLFLSKSGASTGLDWSEIFLLIFGVMVAVGVLGESAKSEKWKKWHRMFELLVIIGVAGELFADGTIFVFSKHLQTISDTELAAAIRKAGDAEVSANNAANSAEKAVDSAQQAESLAHSARREADSFEQDIVSAKKQAADAESHLADALQRVVEAEAKSLSLQKELRMQGPRQNLLVGDTRRALVDCLKPFAFQKIDVRRSAWAMEVNGAVVSSTPLGEDTIGVSEALVSILKEAGWQVPPGPLLGAWQGYEINVWFRQAASARTMSAAIALTQALKRVPLNVSGPTPVTKDLTERVGTAIVSPPLTDDTIILTVLTHP